MKITELIWIKQFLDKIEQKHGVNHHEVEQVFANHPRIQFSKRGMFVAKICIAQSDKLTPDVTWYYSSYTNDQVVSW